MGKILQSNSYTAKTIGATSTIYCKGLKHFKGLKDIKYFKVSEGYKDLKG